MQVVSDLHLEFYRNPLEIKLKISSEYLALLGDICVCGNSDIKNVEQFLDFYSPKYKLIFWIPGNHEFYTNKKNPLTIEEIFIRIKVLVKKYANVIFLNNQHYDLAINNKYYRIIGTTLWTNIPEEKEKYVTEYLNDYQHIYVMGEGYSGLVTFEKPKKIKPIHVNLMYLKASKYIARHIRDSTLPLIIFTHHKPFLSDEKIPSSMPARYAQHRDPTGYESDQITKLTDKDKRKIAIWCYGHTHKHFEGEILGIRFFSNPKGYPGQQTKFENKLSINP